jgi:hypothetical protein
MGVDASETMKNEWGWDQYVEEIITVYEMVVSP